MSSKFFPEYQAKSDEMVDMLFIDGFWYDPLFRSIENNLETPESGDENDVP